LGKYFEFGAEHTLLVWLISQIFNAISELSAVMLDFLFAELNTLGRDLVL
jgi:hypothetical protein